MVRSVGQLLRLLGSSSDGEVTAAARAICRALARDGLDLHWLGDRVDGALTNDTEAKPRLDVEDHQATAAWLLEHRRQWLRKTEIDFLETMCGWIGDPTHKQAAWLNKLCIRHGYRP